MAVSAYSVIAELPKLKFAGSPGKCQGCNGGVSLLGIGFEGLPVLSAAPLRSLSPGRARPF